MDNETWYVDAAPESADWLRYSWDLPEYKSPGFMFWLEKNDLTLEEFKDFPCYKEAVNQGWIVNDEWTGKIPGIPNPEDELPEELENAGG